MPDGAKSVKIIVRGCVVVRICVCVVEVRVINLKFNELLTII